MAEPARRPDGEEGQERKPLNLRQKVSDGADLIPFVGGVKMMGESVAGKDVAGRTLSGRERVAHGAMGAGSLALDFTGVGEVEKAGLAAEKAAIGFTEKEGAESLGKDTVRPQEESAQRHFVERGASDARKNIEVLRRQRDRVPGEGQRRREVPGQEQLRPGDPDDEKTQKKQRARTKAKEERGQRRRGVRSTNDILANKGDLNDAQAIGMVRQAIRSTFENIETSFSKAGEHFDTEDVEKIVNDTPPPPSFPYFMVVIALIKDLIDIPGDLLVVGVILTTILAIVADLIIFMWSWHKMGGWWWKKMIFTWFWKRFIFEVIIEIIPFAQIIPATTILVLMTHYRETKIVKLLNGALEEIHEAGILKYIT